MTKKKPKNPRAKQATGKWVTPEDLDPECYELCVAINELDGIKTTESCCGHGKTPFHVWFEAEAIADLDDLLYWFSWCHCGYRGWQVIVYTDCIKTGARFLIEGPVGGYTEANTIAALIREWKRQTAGQPKITREEKASFRAEIGSGMHSHRTPAYLGYFPIGKPLIAF